VQTLTVEAGEAGLRLDVFLVRRGLFASAAACRRFLSAPGARVLVQGRPARKGKRLQAGQQVELPVEGEEQTAAFALEPDASLPLRVLYEDEALVGVDKPAGVPSHPLRAGERGTLASALAARFPECASASPDPREGGLVHRLDVGTSGVLIAARRRELWTPLRESLGQGACEKIYLAEVAGHATAMVVDAPIGRVGRRGDHVRVGTGRGLLEARTEIRVRQGRAETTLIEARLSRGRPHQVRVHLSHAGWPVLGDPIYGDDAARRLAEALGVQGLRLHAASVRFTHPVTGAPIAIEAPPPDWAG
jgi:23S rRNA pseudouridine1911/1915/1917 synthase